MTRALVSITRFGRFSCSSPAWIFSSFCNKISSHVLRNPAGDNPGDMGSMAERILQRVLCMSIQPLLSVFAADSSAVP